VGGIASTLLYKCHSSSIIEMFELITYEALYAFQSEMMKNEYYTRRIALNDKFEHIKLNFDDSDSKFSKVGIHKLCIDKEYSDYKIVFYVDIQFLTYSLSYLKHFFNVILMYNGQFGDKMSSLWNELFSTDYHYSHRNYIYKITSTDFEFCGNTRLNYVLLRESDLGATASSKSLTKYSRYLDFSGISEYELKWLSQTSKGNLVEDSHVFTKLLNSGIRISCTDRNNKLFINIRDGDFVAFRNLVAKMYEKKLLLDDDGTSYVIIINKNRILLDDVRQFCNKIKTFMKKYIESYHTEFIPLYIYYGQLGYLKRNYANDEKFRQLVEDLKSYNIIIALDRKDL
jgi:hypothetical protein